MQKLQQQPVFYVPFFVRCCLEMPHVSVYVDESGDVGFTDRASQFFTIGYAFTVDRSSAKEDKAIQRALKNVNAGSKKKNFRIQIFSKL